MTNDKFFDVNEHVKKKDLELILEVNKKAIEIETEMVDQNEEIIEALQSNKETLEDIKEKIEALTKQSTEMNKDLFKIQVLFITGLLSLVVQVIQIFIKK